jgi:CO/xanthine dehydrogenase FAD-binding subunit
MDEQVTEEGLRIGAAVTLSRLMETAKTLCASRPPEQTSVLAAIREQLRWFAGNQVGLYFPL